MSIVKRNTSDLAISLSRSKTRYKLKRPYEKAPKKHIESLLINLIRVGWAEADYNSALFVRRKFEYLISKARVDSRTNRILVRKWLPDNVAVNILFNILAPRYKYHKGQHVDLLKFNSSVSNNMNCGFVKLRNPIETNSTKAAVNKVRHEEEVLEFEAIVNQLFGSDVYKVHYKDSASKLNREALASVLKEVTNLSNSFEDISNLDMKA